jgi:hypothetical protein
MMLSLFLSQPISWKARPTAALDVKKVREDLSPQVRHERALASVMEADERFWIAHAW